MIIFKKKKEFSTSQLITFGFLTAIIIGAILLTLPISSASGEWTSFIDALFTSTTSVCVTGLTVVYTYEYWSIFGQVIILLLIQSGGLGIITFTTSIMLLLGKRISLKDRLLIEDAFNLSTLKGLVRFLKKIVIGTFVVEGIGAICYMFVFIPEFGIIKGAWISIFNGVSAFCNAGIDIIGPTGLMPYASHPWINLVTMCLIILGGIGFIVWWDAIRVIKLYKKKDIAGRKILAKMNLHSKIVITATFYLILVGAGLILILEFTNPLTLGNMSLFDKVMASFFQSVTTRTAGFATISQKGLTDSAALICMILMFIGGSPVGTAGGIKTTTISMVFLSALATIRGTEEVTAFRRTIPRATIRKGIAVTVIFLATLFTLIMALSIVTKADFIDVAFETVSAMGTVGISRDLTFTLNTAGKIIIIIAMYFGRIGPISLALAFGIKGKKAALFTYAKEDISVG